MTHIDRVDIRVSIASIILLTIGYNPQQPYPQKISVLKFREYKLHNLRRYSTKWSASEMVSPIKKLLAP